MSTVVFPMSAAKAYLFSSLIEKSFSGMDLATSMLSELAKASNSFSKDRSTKGSVHAGEWFTHHVEGGPGERRLAMIVKIANTSHCSPGDFDSLSPFLRRILRVYVI